MKNFGHNVVYEPQHYYEPKTEAEVLEILEKHKSGHVRVQSTGHSWSDIVGADDALVNLKHFRKITVEERDSGPVARIGAGAQLQEILDTLHRSSSYTLPTMGGIKLQTIAGATATATHGTGNMSLSGFVEAVRLACFDSSGNSRIVDITGGEELLAARASLGCMGVILEITLRVVPKFWMEEQTAAHPSATSVLGAETQWPQQQFFVLPYARRWYAYHRKKVTDPGERTKRFMLWFKIYDYLMVEIGVHSFLKLVEWLTNLFGYRIASGFWSYLVPPVVRPIRVTGDSETIFTLHTEHHYTFRHVEMELFAPREHIEKAAAFTQEAIEYFAGSRTDIGAEMRSSLESAGLLEEYRQLYGSYVHYYPLFFRHILPEDTLVAMNQGGERYSMSVFTFRPPRSQKQYYRACDFLARALAKVYSCRPHWGKYNPLGYEELKPLYPNLDRFREICRAYDPNQVFQNEYTKRVLGL